MSRQSQQRNIQWSALYYNLKMNESTVTAEKLSVMNWLTFWILMSRQSLKRNIQWSPIYYILKMNESTNTAETFQWWTDYYILNINESTITAEKLSVMKWLRF